MSDLQSIPGVGKSMEMHLQRLGVRCVSDLRGADPEALFEEDRILCGGTLDRCVLYVYRAAVYFAETAQPAPEKCNWWYWKD